MNIRRQSNTRYDPENIQYDPFLTRYRPKPIDLHEDELELKQPAKDEDNWLNGIPRAYYWGAVWFGGRLKLVWYTTDTINGKMNKTVYLSEILEGEVKTWLAENPDFILEEDRDSGYGCKKGEDKYGIVNEPVEIQTGEGGPRGCKVTAWKKKHGIRYFFNPTDSPDVAPIENVWKWISQKLQAMPTLPMTRRELIERVTRLWNELPQEWIDLRIMGGKDRSGQVIPSMRKRWEDVLAADGEPCGY
jgi:hypothetical protein